MAWDKGDVFTPLLTIAGGILLAGFCYFLWVNIPYFVPAAVAVPARGSEVLPTIILGTLLLLVGIWLIVLAGRPRLKALWLLPACFVILIHLVLLRGVFQATDLWKLHHLVVMDVAFGFGVGLLFAAATSNLGLPPSSEAPVRLRRVVVLCAIAASTAVLVGVEASANYRSRIVNIGRLGSKDPSVRLAAAKILTNSGSCSSAIIGALRDPEAEIRRLMAMAVGEAKCREAITSLRTLLGDDDPGVRLASVVGMDRIWEEWRVAIPMDDIVRLTQVPGPFAGKEEASRLLERIGGPEAEKALLDRLRAGDSRVLAAAYRYYIQLGVVGSEHELVRALSQHGTYQFAEAGLHAGNPTLAEAASLWLISAGGKPEEITPCPSQPLWGERQWDTH